jgi:hypothetical protein
MTIYGTGSLVMIEVPMIIKEEKKDFLDYNGGFFRQNNEKIRTQKCFFILTCAHNIIYKEKITDKDYKFYDYISIILGKNKNLNIKEAVNDEYALKLSFNPRNSLIP